MVQWLRLCTPIAGSLEPNLGQGTRLLMLQLKIPCAPAKTQGSQVDNKYLKNKPPPSKRKSSSLSLTVSPPCLYYTRWGNSGNSDRFYFLGLQLIRKDPDTGKDWGQEEMGLQSMSWLDGIIDSLDIVWANSRSAAVHGVTKNRTALATEQQE